MQIKLTEDQIDEVLITELKQRVECFELDYARRKNGDIYAIFEHDLNEDLKIIKKHIKACKRLLKYYGVGEE